MSTALSGVALATPLIEAPAPPGVPPLTVVPPSPAAWGAADAVRAAHEALATLGLGADDLTLVRDVSTVVFRLRDVAVKVYPPTVDVVRQHAVYAALRGSSECVLPLAGPLLTPYGVVTLWPWVETAPPVTWPEIGGLLRRFHRTPVDPLAVPAWRPLSRLPEQVSGLDAGRASVLLAARERLLAQVDCLRSGLGYGLIHGDVSVENTLRHSDGSPVLIDLDFVAYGPREYDLVGAYLRLARGVITQATYNEFCSAYGADVRDWAELPLVVGVCDLGGLTFGIWAAEHQGTTLPDLDARIDRWR